LLAHWLLMAVERQVPRIFLLPHFVPLVKLAEFALDGESPCMLRVAEVAKKGGARDDRRPSAASWGRTFEMLAAGDLIFEPD
jgi:hypothetical protein